MFDRLYPKMHVHANWAAVVITVLMILSVCIQLLHVNTVPVYDQKTLLKFTFSQNIYPSLESGIVSSLIIGVLKILPYAPLSMNTFLRVVAATAYLAAAALLGFSVAKRCRHPILMFTLFMLLMLTSRFPFLWLSSELFAGTFMAMSFWGGLEKKYGFAALCFALLALTKPDMLVPTVVAATFFFLFNKQPRLLVVTIVLLGILVFPAIFAKNARFTGNRSAYSFCQHYAAMVVPMQIAPSSSLPSPWSNCSVYLRSGFGSVNNMSDIVRANPSLYLDFIFLSLSNSLKKFVLSNLIFLLPLVLIFGKHFPDKTLAWTFTILFAVNAVVILSLSYFHVRYQARYYPLALGLILGGVERHPRVTSQKLALGALIGIFSWQSIQAVKVLSQGVFFID